MQIGIAGLGVVAQSTLELIRDHQADLSSIADQSIEVRSIASRRLREEVDLRGIEFSTDLTTLSRNPDIDLVIELIGGTDAALVLIKDCLEQGKAVITANKAVIAEHGNELIQLAIEKNTPLAFEAAVAGGIPIVNALKTEMPANDIEWIAGIINGTCNYILTSMSQEGTSFEEALSIAQELGYAEADPSFDIEGTDAAQKLAILAGLAFHTPIQSQAVHCEGITQVSLDDITHAEELGYAIKHLAIMSKHGSSQQLYVSPALIPLSNLLAKVDGVENTVQLGTASAGVLRFLGPGAGGHATASAVIGDLMNIARGQYRPVRLSHVPDEVESVEKVVSAHYMNITAADKPGVIAVIGETLARHNISIASMVQKKEEAHPELEGSVIPVIILTNEVPFSALREAMTELEDLADIVGSIRTIRVANFT